MKRFMNKMNEKKGFTLAELLIVVAIIAVLVAIAIPVFNTQLEKAREATDLANLRAAYAEQMTALLEWNGTGTIDAKTITEVQAFLTNEGYEIIKVEPQKKNSFTMDITLFGGKLKSGELSFVLTQISTYLKAGIPLVDAVRILTRQTEKASKRKIYEKIVYDLVSGEKFSTALENQEDVFPRLLINMVKASELTGDLPQILDEMALVQKKYPAIYSSIKSLHNTLLINMDYLSLETSCADKIAAYAKGTTSEDVLSHADSFSRSSNNLAEAEDKFYTWLHSRRR